VVADYASASEPLEQVGAWTPVDSRKELLEVARDGKSLICPVTNPAFLPPFTTKGDRQLMLVALQARGEVIGAIGLTHGVGKRSFTDSDLSLAETIAGQIAGAIENARLFQESQRAKEEAEAANEAKSAFLANISHELRTPLTAVLGFSRIIQKRLDEQVFPNIASPGEKTRRAMQQVHDNIDIILAEGNRLTTLINNVLDLSKIEAGKIEWKMTVIAPNEVIDHALASTTSLFLQKDLQLIRDVEENLPQIYGDHDRLIQVLINLISNAVKFTPQGSITCRARCMDDRVIISVIDTGIGILEADQPKVFEKFLQVGETLTDKPQGSGLGLTISKEIIERHNGQIWLESQVGVGSTFSFSLPVLEARQQPDEKGGAWRAEEDYRLQPNEKT
jgi:signal transduction histidine kinase